MLARTSTQQRPRLQHYCKPGLSKEAVDTPLGTCFWPLSFWFSSSFWYVTALSMVSCATRSISCIGRPYTARIGRGERENQRNRDEGEEGEEKEEQEEAGEEKKGEEE